MVTPGSLDGSSSPSPRIGAGHAEGRALASGPVFAAEAELPTEWECPSLPVRWRGRPEVRSRRGDHYAAWVPIRLLLCDVDGTVLGSHAEHVSERVRHAVQRTAAAGVTVGFATGRTTFSLKPVVDDLGLSQAWAVCNNGTVLAHYSTDLPDGFEVVRQTTFDPAPAVHRLLTALPGAVVASWQDTTYLTTRLFPPGELVAEQVVPLSEVLATPTTKAVLRWPGRACAEVLALLDEIELPPDVTGVPSKHVAWLDLLPAGVSKATGAATLAGQLGLTAAEVMAIGDDYNDLELLRWAGHGVAMGGAPAAVVEAADASTTGIDQDGVADALDALVADLGRGHSTLPSIRPATPADHAVLQGVEDAADRLLIDWLGATSWSAAAPGETRAALDGFVLVLELDGAVVGFAHVLDLGRVAHLEQLSVTPEHGHRGHGRRLLDAAITEARRRGHHRMTLRTYADVPWNAPFYQRHGFTEEEPATAFDRSLVATEQRLGLDGYGRRVQLGLDL